MFNCLKKLNCLLVTLWLLLIANVPLYAQTSITGPTCVVPGTSYSYQLRAAWKASSVMKVCINGGKLITKDSLIQTCTPEGGAPLASVLVSFDRPGNASIVVSSALGNSTLKVVVVMPLSSGTIGASSKTQMLANGVIPTAITCSIDSGGSCSPSYTHQWQQSTDMSTWVDVPGGTGKNLSFDAAVTQSMYYRRRVTEEGSGSIAYSNVVPIFVDGPTTTSK